MFSSLLLYFILLQMETKLYLDNLKSKYNECKIRNYVTRRSLRKIMERNICSQKDVEKNDDVIVLDEDTEDSEVVSRTNLMKAKLLQFNENNRPPYYGTWRKKSKHICPKNPFKQDEVSSERTGFRKAMDSSQTGNKVTSLAETWRTLVFERSFKNLQLTNWRAGTNNKQKIRYHLMTACLALLACRLSTKSTVSYSISKNNCKLYNTWCSK